MLILFISSRYAQVIMEKNFIVVMKSKINYEILRQLDEKPLIPIMLSKALKRPRPSISRALNELVEHNLVKCENPKDKKFRFYSITSIGKDVLKEAGKYN